MIWVKNRPANPNKINFKFKFVFVGTRIPFCFNFEIGRYEKNKQSFLFVVRFLLTPCFLEEKTSKSYKWNEMKKILWSCLAFGNFYYELKKWKELKFLFLIFTVVETTTTINHNHTKQLILKSIFILLIFIILFIINPKTNVELVYNHHHQNQNLFLFLMLKSLLMVYYQNHKVIYLILKHELIFDFLLLEMNVAKKILMHHLMIHDEYLILLLFEHGFLNGNLLQQ